MPLIRVPLKKKKDTNVLTHSSWLQSLAWKWFTGFTLVSVLHTQPQCSQTQSSH